MRKLILVLSLLIGALIVFTFVSPLTRTREEQVARALAKKEARNRGWNFIRVTSVINESNRWVIQLERFPPEFGGHAVVEIVDGKVTQYRPGK